MPAWTVPVLGITPPKRLEALTGVVPSGLAHRRFWSAPACSSPRRQSRPRDELGGSAAKSEPGSRQRVMDLHDVLMRALQAFQPRTAVDWLVGNGSRQARSRSPDRCPCCARFRPAWADRRPRIGKHSLVTATSEALSRHSVRRERRPSGWNEGGAVFVPPGGSNRIDNPDLYRDVLYVAATPEAAVAESFGRIPLWTAQTFHSRERAPAVSRDVRSRGRREGLRPLT